MARLQENVPEGWFLGDLTLECAQRLPTQSRACPGAKGRKWATPLRGQCPVLGRGCGVCRKSSVHLSGPASFVCVFFAFLTSFVLQTLRVWVLDRPPCGLWFHVAHRQLRGVSFSDCPTAGPSQAHHGAITRGHPGPRARGRLG